MCILVIEDEEKLNKMLCKCLKLEGFETEACFDGLSAVNALVRKKYELAILDIMLPCLGGFDVIQQARDAGCSTPIIVLSAMARPEDRIRGLELGADDYLTKPFLQEELIARVRALLRREIMTSSQKYYLADLFMDANMHLVKRGNERITLSAKEFSLLKYLFEHKGTVMSRDQIERDVWNFDFDGDSNIIDVYIRYLRKKIDDGRMPKLIHTVRGVGYVLRDNALFVDEEK